jgi:hypothetical protein
MEGAKLAQIGREMRPTLPLVYVRTSLVAVVPNITVRYATHDIRP